MTKEAPITKAHEAEELTAGGAIFTRLKALGIDYVFVNSGTDFPPIIEGLAEADAKDIDLPKPLIMPHEMAAVGMAHGHFLGSGKPQCVMLHTNVGLSNGATGIINAACDRVPMVVMSGRTPTTEQGRFGSRTVPIGWGQEMLDQTALVRECSKWDYELRFPEQLREVIDRGHAIASSTPKGPVYISLPREILCEQIAASSLEGDAVMQPVSLAPDGTALAEAAQLLRGAQNPIVVSQEGIVDPVVFNRFADFVESWALPVNQFWPIKLSLPITHPMSLGTDLTKRVAAADVILVIDSLAPWWPDKVQPNPHAKVIQLGPDPLFSRKPIRNFRADISLVGETPQALSALMDEMGMPDAATAVALTARRDAIAKESEAIRNQIAKRIESQALATPSTKEYVGHCLTKLLAEEDHAVFSELGVPLGAFAADRAESWFQEPPSGGLGWSFPASLGYKLARPEKTVVCTLGDGSYMFANPTVCHQIAESLDLPIVIVVLNNQEWGAVRHSVIGMYPDGYAAKANEVPLTALKPTPDFTLTAKASRSPTLKANSSSEVEEVLREAIALSKSQNNAVFVEVAIS